MLRRESLSCRRGSQVVRQRSAKPLFGGSIPPRASNNLVAESAAYALDSYSLRVPIVPAKSRISTHPPGPKPDRTDVEVDFQETTRRDAEVQRIFGQISKEARARVLTRAQEDYCFVQRFKRKRRRKGEPETEWLDQVSGASRTPSIHASVQRLPRAPYC